MEKSKSKARLSINGLGKSTVKSNLISTSWNTEGLTGVLIKGFTILKDILDWLSVPTTSVKLVPN